MLSEFQTWVVVAISAVIWLALLFVGIVSGTPTQVWAVADLIPALVMGVTLFERLIWRWTPLHPHIVGMPIVRGTWKGGLESMWSDPKTGERLPTKTVYLAVEQTLTTVFVRLMTDASSSEQVAGAVRRKDAGRHAIYAIYLNTPQMGRRGGSPIHYGGMILDIGGTPPSRLWGEYWTERQSKGRLTFVARSSHVADSLVAAEGLTFS